MNGISILTLFWPSTDRCSATYEPVRTVFLELLSTIVLSHVVKIVVFFGYGSMAASARFGVAVVTFVWAAIRLMGVGNSFVVSSSWCSEMLAFEQVPALTLKVSISERCVLNSSLTEWDESEAASGCSPISASAVLDLMSVECANYNDFKSWISECVVSNSVIIPTRRTTYITIHSIMLLGNIDISIAPKTAAVTELSRTTVTRTGCCAQSDTAGRTRTGHSVALCWATAVELWYVEMPIV